MALLSFSSAFPWGDPTNFEAKILAGIKPHTFRSGNGWYPGRLIDLWIGSPRNKGSYKLPELEFDKVLQWKTVTRKNKQGQDYEINLPVCSAVESWKMDFGNLGDSERSTTLDFTIGGLKVDENLLEVVATMDGFDNVDDFLRWFQTSAKKKKKTVLTGQLVHWTDKVYDLATAQTIDHDYFNPPV